MLLKISDDFRNLQKKKRIKNGLLLLLCGFFFWLLSNFSLHAENLYRVFFCSKGTGPTNVEIEALNDAGAREQVKAAYPGAYSIVILQLPNKKEPKK